MRKGVFTHALSLALGAVLGVLCAYWALPRADDLRGPANFYVFPVEKKLSKQEKLALQGDKVSSNTVVDTVIECATAEYGGLKRGTECAAVQNYWHLVDAENGGAIGITVTRAKTPKLERIPC